MIQRYYALIVTGVNITYPCDLTGKIAYYVHHVDPMSSH